MKNAVVTELCNLDLTDSISLKLIISFMKISFKNLIYAFNLIICFKIMSNEEFYFNVKTAIYLISKVIDKL